MNAVDESAKAPPMMTPFRKLIGVVPTRDRLGAVTEALRQFGATEVEVLNGVLGIETLEDKKDVVSHFIFGDMEAVMVQRYLTAVKNGLIVFAAEVEPKSVEEAAGAIKALGATDIVHFGEWVITNY